MLPVVVELIRDGSVRFQFNENCGWVGDQQPLCGGRATYRSGHMIRAVHLCPERLTRKEGIQEGLPKEKQLSARHLPLR